MDTHPLHVIFITFMPVYDSLKPLYLIRKILKLAIYQATPHNFNNKITFVYLSTIPTLFILYTLNIKFSDN